MPLKEPPLTAGELATLKARLEARARQLRGELAEALHSGEPGGAHLANRREEVDDDAVAAAETLVDVASVERDDRELSDVAAALARLDREGFGLCAECGEPIGRARLFAIPQALRCIECEREAPPAPRHATL